MLLLSLIPASVMAQGNKPLNIIYIMTDDHAQQTMSCYDGSLNQTPGLDRLAKEGVLFENSFVTNSISGPSRAVLITGKFSHLNGFRDNASTFDGSQQTFPKLLQKAGYQTAIIGKWHLVSQPTGFDYWTILPGQGSYYNPDFITANGKEKVEGYVTNIITDKSIDWIE
ncbi:MAG: sulfatase-like hydrolase/transferase, partial [Mucinivorans sp.]